MRKKYFLIAIPALVFICSICVLKEFWLFLQRAAEKAYKHEIYYRIFHRWLSIREDKKSLESFFVENHIRKIGIYGMGMLGIHLMKDLQDGSLVEISYGIDRSVENVDGISKIYKPDDFLPPVDMIVVTAIFSFDEVKEILRERIDCPVVSIEEIIQDAS